MRFFGILIVVCCVMGAFGYHSNGNSTACKAPYHTGSTSGSIYCN